MSETQEFIVPDSPFSGTPRAAERRLHVALFVQRFPPALGGSEAYTARLADFLHAHGDGVGVWTSTAVELGEMWGRRGEPSRPAKVFGCVSRGPTPPGPPSRQGGGGKELPRAAERFDTEVVVSPPPCREGGPGGVGPRDTHPNTPRGWDSPHRYAPLHFPARRYILRALSLIPFRRWQCLTSPCNPVCPEMWRDAGSYRGPLDAVHATAFPYSFPIACALRLARRRRVPFLLTPFLHLGDPTDPHDRTRRQYTKPHLRWLLRQADRVFVQTQNECEAVIGLGVAAKRVVLQGLGVDPADCTGGSRELARAGWGVDPGEMLIGHLANNSAEKGTVDLLRAAERTWDAGHRFRVVLAGPEMPNFRAFWHSFGPKASVTRLGVLSEQQKRDFFAGLDAFALPSRCDSFGLVLLEAWANGLPNLVYRAGGPSELVRDGIDGLQAACGDVSQLAQHLGRMCADPELRRALGVRGQLRVGTEFRWADKLNLVRDTVLDLTRC